MQRYVNPLNAGDSHGVVDEDAESAVSEDPKDEEMRELPDLIEKKVAHLLLKMENIFNVPQRYRNYTLLFTEALL